MAIKNNQEYIPNYGERYRCGERISTAFAESTVNQVVSKRMVKKQQMAWTERGAHFLLQVRTRVLHGDLEETFRRGYPQFRSEQPLPLEGGCLTPRFVVSIFCTCSITAASFAGVKSSRNILEPRSKRHGRHGNPDQPRRRAFKPLSRSSRLGAINAA
jgi:hypothetical protein